jgi:hypothetical protein
VERPCGSKSFEYDLCTPNKQPIRTLASLSLKTPLTANKLTSDGSGSVTLSNNAHMTISEFDALNHGCQCNFRVISKRNRL